MTPQPAPAPRTAMRWRMSRFEEEGARLRNDQWDAQKEIAEADFMARYDRRILLVELDAIRAEAATSR